MTAAPWPTELRLKDKGRLLAIAFDDGGVFELPAEYLRVASPSAEVQGHSAEQRKTIGGKRDVKILDVAPVGNYAVRILFDDGHDTGIYSWDLLYHLGTNQEELWQDYLAKLEAAGASRDIDSTTPPPKAGGSCGHH